MPSSKKRLDKWETQHRRNLSAYERQITDIFRAAVSEAAALTPLLGGYDPDKPFKFSDYPITRQRVERLLNGLKNGVYGVIANGVRSEWTLSNNKNSELCNQVFGENVKSLTEEQYRRYYSTNPKAEEAFLARREQGLDLSDRVWRYTNQFKEEIEMGLEMGIRDGLDADGMSRQLRSYLQNPDSLFRRVRDEHGILQLSKAARAFHPGRGVYRSSYKNARRLAATECNMAYRTADHERWQELDFVVGIRVVLSNNHTLNGVPFEDICDQLSAPLGSKATSGRGCYPKDFKFTGWHPHCRCHAESILKTREEMAEDNDRILAGEPVSDSSENAVSDVPPEFRAWIRDNAGRMEKAKSLPYFIRDNERYVREAKTRKTALEIAEERHAARTPEQAAEIRERWSRRRAVHHYGENMLRYFEGIPDVDTTPLLNAVRSGNIEGILAEGSKLKAVGKEILSYKYLDNPMQVARQFSAADAKAVNEAVRRKLDEWTGFSLVKQKSKLEFEIKWIQDNKKYSTWEVAQKAYRKQLAIVDDRIDWDSIVNGFKIVSGFKTSSKKYHGLMDDLQNAISRKDKDGAKAILQDLKAQREHLEKERAKPKLGKAFGKDAYSRERKKAALNAETREEADDSFRKKTEKLWADASKEQKLAATGYTEGSGSYNRPLRGYDGNWDNYKGIGKVSLNNEGAGQQIKDLTALIDKSISDRDVWLQRGIETRQGAAGFLGMSTKEFKSIASQADADKLVGRICTDTAFVSCGSAQGTGFSGTILHIYCPKGTKMIYAEPFSYYNGDGCSTSSLWDGNGKYALQHELETIIQRGTQFRITGATYKYGNLTLDVEVIAQP